jgi:hypothetical protein
VEVTPGCITSEKLTACQHDAAQGLYALAMSAFIAWLAGRYEAVREAVVTEAAALRAQFHSEGQHARTPAIRAELTLGWRSFLKFAAESGALGEEEAKSIRLRAECGLLYMAEAQAEHQQAAEPVNHFLSLLRSAIASGRCHIASPEGARPAELPEAWGWRRESGFNSTEWNPQGKRVGWVDAKYLYLDPDAAHAEAQKLATEQGESIPIGAKTLSKRLDEKGKLLLTDKSRGGLTVRKTLEHKRMNVWCISRHEGLSPEKSTQSDQSAREETEV